MGELDILGSNTEKIAECKTFFSADAYYWDEDSLIPMEYFAPELLDAKSEQEVENICKRYGYKHGPYSPYAIPEQYSNYYKYPWTFNLTDDFVLSYAS